MCEERVKKQQIMCEICFTFAGISLKSHMFYDGVFPLKHTYLWMNFSIFLLLTQSFFVYYIN